MYVVMCEIRKHSDFWHPEQDQTVLLSAHPIDIAADLDEAHAWMYREPEIIVDYLNNVTEDKWRLGYDRNESHAQILNEDYTIERLYVYRHVE